MRIRTTARIGKTGVMAAAAALAIAGPVIGPASSANAATGQAAATVQSASPQAAPQGRQASSQRWKERYLYVDLKDGALLGRVVVDLKNRDFTVCDKKSNGHRAYAMFDTGVVSPNPPYYWDTKSGSKCTHYNKKISKKRDVVSICQSQPFFDKCNVRGVRWW